MNTDTTSKKGNSYKAKTSQTLPYRPRCIGRGWTPAFDANQREPKVSHPNN